MTKALCPVDAKTGKPVPVVTLRSLVLPEHAAVIEARDWLLCDRPDCGVVYFTREGMTIDKGALKVRVGIKEKGPHRTICYCFGHTVESILAEVVRTGRSTVAASIRGKVEAAECSCQFLNPKGTCCLGDVNEAVNQAFASTGVPRPEGTPSLPQCETANEDCCRPVVRGARGEREACRLSAPVPVGQGIDSGSEE